MTQWESVSSAIKHSATKEEGICGCREDVANLCIALLEEPSALNATFEIKSTVPFSQPFTIDPGQQPAKRDWAALLSAAQLRPGVTGKPEDSDSSARHLVQ